MPPAASPDDLRRGRAFAAAALRLARALRAWPGMKKAHLAWGGGWTDIVTDGPEPRSAHERLATRGPVEAMLADPVLTPPGFEHLTLMWERADRSRGKSGKPLFVGRIKECNVHLPDNPARLAERVALCHAAARAYGIVRPAEPDRPAWTAEFVVTVRTDRAWRSLANALGCGATAADAIRAGLRRAGFALAATGHDHGRVRLTCVTAAPECFDGAVHRTLSECGDLAATLALAPSDHS